MTKASRNSVLWMAAALFCVGLTLGVAGQEGSDDTIFSDFLASYDEAFNAKDLDKLATFYDPEVTIFEGGGINRGWADYRDHHLGPELEAFQDLEFGHRDVKARWLGESSAYVTAEYHLKTRYKKREIDMTGLSTLILLEGEDGVWRIRHSHTSSRRRRQSE